MTLFPQAQNTLKMLKLSSDLRLGFLQMAMSFYGVCYEMFRLEMSRRRDAAEDILEWTPEWLREELRPLLDLYYAESRELAGYQANAVMEALEDMYETRRGEADFLELLAEDPPQQDWTFPYGARDVLLDLPGFRLIDVSREGPHEVRNYTVVVAPRAGHHSNIAERVALSMRDRGLTRMAVVEQKCADDIPLYVEGRMHSEGFAGQVEQYRQMLELLRERTGRPAHLVAICQPGPLLMSTLILYPHLGRTFGSAGAPMHTDAQEGPLTDFARSMGEWFIDLALAFSGRSVRLDRPGAGRPAFDGRLQVLGFYLLGLNQHLRNLTRLLHDLRQGNEEAAARQKSFYQWYNFAHHFPAEFIRDTYKKVFVRNDLARGELEVGERRIGLADYPARVPIWALGGSRDDIAPPGQATGHMDLLDQVSADHKLKLICEGGHMGLFRSSRVLGNEYARIVRFLLDHSDRDGRGDRPEREEAGGSETVAGGARQGR
jgi:polyhydroxyalkanoate depolymerase